jgi:MoxR-like ATPase
VAGEPTDWPGRIRYHLAETKAVILQGPPGTGKTHHAREAVAEFSDEINSGDDPELDNRRWTSIARDVPTPHLHTTDVDLLATDDKSPDVIWELIQFHPGYSYEDFVRGMGTETADDTDTDTGQSDGFAVKFTPRDRILVQLVEVAHQYSETAVVLILDELNRADVSAVLGELILTIDADKRSTGTVDNETDAAGWPVKLQYPPPDAWNECHDERMGQSLTLPENLYIIGTMNTADQSTARIDYAIRRRFRILDVRPDLGAIYDHYNEAADRYTDTDTPPQAAIPRFYQTLTQRLRESDLPAAYQIGHSYFMLDHDMVAEQYEDWQTALADAVVSEVVPTLRRYYRDGVLYDHQIQLGTEDRLDVLATKKGGNNRDTIISSLDNVEQKLYIINSDFDNEDGQQPSRHGAEGLRRGFVAGGKGTGAAEGVIELGKNADLILLRKNKGDGNGYGIIGIGVPNTPSTVYKSDRNLRKMEIHSTADDYSDRYSDWNSKLKELLSLNIGRAVYDENKIPKCKKETEEFYVGVDWLVGIPGVMDIISEAGGNLAGVHDEYQEEVENQSVVIDTGTGVYKNAKSVPGLPSAESIADDDNYLISSTKIRSTAKVRRNKNETWMLVLFVVKYFQTEFRFDLERLPTKYQDRIGQAEKRLESHIPDSAPREPELLETIPNKPNASLIAKNIANRFNHSDTNYADRYRYYSHLPDKLKICAGEDGQDENTDKVAMRVYIPVFSSTVATRDEEFIYDGEHIHVVTRASGEWVYDEDAIACPIEMLQTVLANADDMDDDAFSWTKAEPYDCHRLRLLYRVLRFAQRNELLSDLIDCGNLPSYDQLPGINEQASEPGTRSPEKLFGRHDGDNADAIGFVEALEKEGISNGDPVKHDRIQQAFDLPNWLFSDEER